MNDFICVKVALEHWDMISTSHRVLQAG